MKYMKKIASLLMLLLTVGFAMAQSTDDLRINELLIKNVDNYADEYGRHVPWVEIFNSAYNTVNLAGCYLTDDTTGLAAVKEGIANPPAHWYRIPQTDVSTALQQRSYAVFYLDNQPLYGTYHVSFDPAKSKNNYIALIKGDGKSVVDMMYYPVELRDTCLVYGCKEDGIHATDANIKADEGTDYLDCFTPGSTNVVNVTISKQEMLKRDDPYGIGLAIISMSVVFAALILIYLMLKVFGRFSTRAARKKAQETAKTPVEAEKAAELKPEEVRPNAEEVAAITAALHLHYSTMHDEESEIITIDMPSAHYSPWAQKELAMRRTPRIRR